VTGIAGNTVIVTGALVTVTGAAQLAFEVICSVTTSLLFNNVELKLAELVPAPTPLTFH
jgi:hypothetical protein